MWADLIKQRTTYYGYKILSGPKTASYTAKSCEHVLVDAAGAASTFAITLPLTSTVGDKVKVTMFGEHATRKVTINDNGQLINGGAANDVYYDLCLMGDTVEFIWVGGGCGWAVVYDGIIQHSCTMSKSSVSITAGNTTKSAYDIEDFDTGGIGDAVTNNRFDIRRAGYYNLMAQAQTTFANLAYALFYIYKNGSAVFVVQNNGAAGGDSVGFSICITLPLSVNDYIETYTYSSGNNLTCNYNYASVMENR